MIADLPAELDCSEGRFQIFGLAQRVGLDEDSIIDTRPGEPEASTAFGLRQSSKHRPTMLRRFDTGLLRRGHWELKLTLQDVGLL